MIKRAVVTGVFALISIAGLGAHERDLLAALGNAVVPATGELISPLTSWLLPLTVTLSRFAELKT